MLPNPLAWHRKESAGINFVIELHVVYYTLDQRLVYPATEVHVNLNHFAFSSLCVAIDLLAPEFYLSRQN